MIFLNVNIWGVIISAVAFMVLGSLWYSPLLFGKQWMKLLGLTPDMKPHKKSIVLSYVGMTVSALVMAYVESVFMKNMFVTWQKDAFHVALLLWVGFIATSSAGEYLFNPKPKMWRLYWINAGYYLVQLVIGAFIIFHFLY